MLSRIVRKILANFGLKIVRLENGVPNYTSPGKQGYVTKFREKIEKRPCDAALHFGMAQAAERSGNLFLALAELKTAIFLGLDKEKANSLHSKLALEDIDLEYMNHNQFYRFSSLAKEIDTLSGGQPASILDVGGGHGALAAFLPEYEYCLVEPDINGISGASLPFDDGAFDYVVSCHVLEHIPPEHREKFLHSLFRKSRKGLILLNPFFVENSCEKERLGVVIDITNARWAKEHLDCSLPSIDLINSFAKEHALELNLKPNGTMLTTFSLVFVDYFSSLSGSRQSMQTINKFFNTRTLHMMDSESWPTAYLVVLKPTGE